MSKPYKEFRFSDWNWIAEHFEPSQAKRIAKVAWSIAQSTPETIPQHSLILDPLIVIPLCAIALPDYINISVLPGNKSFRSEAKQAKNTRDLKQQAQFIEKVLSAIEPSPRWKYLFSSLTPDLQFDLLYRLINYRRPTIVDWRNLFRKVEYEFKNSWHYRLVLVLALAMSMVALVGIVQIIVSQPETWSNGLLGLAILVVFIFWIFLWRGIEEKLEPTTFISFGLFGVFTFWSELLRLFRKKIVWAGAGALAVALALAGTVAAAAWVALALAEAAAWDGAWAAGAVAGMVGATGVWAWVRAKDKQDFGKFLAVFAFPFFCWSPIVICFSTLALRQFLSWPHTLLAWLFVIGIGTALWLRGQKLEEQARNPLKGILVQTEKLN